MKLRTKKIISKKIKSFVKKFFNNCTINFFHKNCSKKALLSYITYPFKLRNPSYYHTNYFEALTWAKILDELGYQVDIVNYDYCSSKIKIEEYDLICGFGEVLEKYIYTPKAKAKTIIYATGMHNCWQNHVTLRRLKEVYKKKGVWLGHSARYVSKFYSSHVSFADAVVALGNDVCVESYKPYCDNVYQLDAPFYKVLNHKEIIKNKIDGFYKHFLWFGSGGAIHKGLDLLLEYFSKRKDIYLHVCGKIENEKEFFKVYNNELLNNGNILYHGFVNIKSEEFKQILRQCGFIIFPSVSEGGSPGVLTCIGNGGLVPIITKETTIDTGYEIWIESLDETGIGISINKALSLSKEKLFDMMHKNGEVICRRNSMNAYEKNLKDILERILLREG